MSSSQINILSNINTPILYNYGGVIIKKSIEKTKNYKPVQKITFFSESFIIKTGISFIDTSNPILIKNIHNY